MSCHGKERWEITEKRRGGRNVSANLLTSTSLLAKLTSEPLFEAGFLLLRVLVLEGVFDDLDNCAALRKRSSRAGSLHLFSARNHHPSPKPHPPSHHLQNGFTKPSPVLRLHLELRVEEEKESR